MGNSSPYLERLRAAKQRSQDAQPEHVMLADAPEETAVEAPVATPAPQAVRVIPVAPPPMRRAPPAPAVRPHVVGALLGIVLGTLVFGLGLLATAASYGHAGSQTNGGMYKAFYGAMIGGGFMVLRGVFRLVAGGRADGAPPTSYTSRVPVHEKRQPQRRRARRVSQSGRSRVRHSCPTI